MCSLMLTPQVEGWNTAREEGNWFGEYQMLFVRSLVVWPADRVAMPACCPLRAEGGADICQLHASSTADLRPQHFG